VKCDATATSQSDIDAGIANMVVGFAPLKPAEFVIITIRQLFEKKPWTRTMVLAMAAQTLVGRAVYNGHRVVSTDGAFAR
jgi:hypothetical protein